MIRYLLACAVAYTMATTVGSTYPAFEKTQSGLWFSVNRSRIDVPKGGPMRCTVAGVTFTEPSPDLDRCVRLVLREMQEAPPLTHGHEQRRDAESTLLPLDTKAVVP